MPDIDINQVSKHYGAVRALHNASLNVKNGEYIVLLGPSGCGKTTLLKIIAGIIEPTSGSVSIGKKNMAGLPPEERNIGFVFQNYALFPHLSVLDNSMYGLVARGEIPDSAKRIATEMLKLVHLENRQDASPKDLSGGMQQRLSIARALATGSKLLLLDEPTNALDAHLRIELRSELRKMVTKLKLTAIHVTHDQDEAMEIADKIVLMRKGGIVQIGTPKEVYEKPSSLFSANFLGGANFIHVFFEKGKCTLLGRDISANHEGEYVAMIRSEHLHFGKRGEKISVIGHRKLGPYHKYEIEHDGVELTVRTQNLCENPTRLTFNPKKVLFFKEPEEGLENMLAVE